MHVAYAEGHDGSHCPWSWTIPARSQRSEPAAILFTDIEDSYGLACALGPLSYADAILDHFGMTHAAVAAAGGEVRQFTGDGVVALWPHRVDGDAAGALRAMVAIALAVACANAAARDQGLPWRRIRLGLHAGVVRSEEVGSGAPPLLLGAEVSLAHRLQASGKKRETAWRDYVATASFAGLAAAGAAPRAAFKCKLFDLSLDASDVRARPLGGDAFATPGVGVMALR